MLKLWACIALVAMAAAPLGAYDLFHPVPADKLRDLNPDRPSRSDGPGTLDAGHWQLEADLANFDHKEDASGLSTDAWMVGDFYVKAGLTDAVDLELGYIPWLRQNQLDRSSAAAQDLSGRGDLVIRLKQNWWGNDGAASALGTVTYVKWPTAAAGLGNGAAEGGMGLPLQLSLPGGFSLGLEAQVGINHDGQGDGYHAVVAGSTVLGHGLMGGLQAYVEYFAAQSQEAGAGLAATLDGGFTWLVAKDLQLDAGVNAGVTPAADAWNPFAGISWRL